MADTKLLLDGPTGAATANALAHGAGAGMDSPLHSSPRGSAYVAIGPSDTE